MGGITRADLQGLDKLIKDPILEEGKDGDDEQKKANKRNNNSGVSTLEKCLANIELKTYEKGQEIDNVFLNATSQFDEAGTKGLLLHNLRIDDSCKLIISSNTENYKTNTIDIESESYF